MEGNLKKKKKIRELENFKQKTNQKNPNKSKYKKIIIQTSISWE